jgi:hypothetical protein
MSVTDRYFKACCFWVRDFILFDIKEAPQGGRFDILTSLLSFSQAQATSRRVSGKSQGEFMNSITSFAAF